MIRPKPTFLPQFDFEGLPAIPATKSYRQRVRYMKQAAALSNSTKSSSRRMGQTEVHQHQNTYPFLPKIMADVSNESKDNDYQSSEESTRPLESNRVLTREKLLEYGQSESVDDVLEVIAVDKGLHSVDISCLTEFINLYYANLSENNIPLDHLSRLPALKDLNLSCNNIRFINIPVEGFLCLEVLDLSFNTFEDPFLFDKLSKLRKLKTLNLSSNNLRHLPRDLKGLVCLEEIILENNALQDDIFTSLNSIPNLKKINLNKNYVEQIPSMELNSLSRIETLLLDTNKIMYCSDLYQIREFKQLKKLSLVDNPITGRRKEMIETKNVLSIPDLNISFGPNEDRDPSVVRRYYPDKIRSVHSFTKMASNTKEKDLTNVESVNSSTTADRDSETDFNASDSFFITAKSMEEEEAPAIVASSILKIKPKKIHRNPSSRSLSTMYESVASNGIKKITESHSGFISSLQHLQEDHTEEKKLDIDGVVIFDYNADWFELDETLEELDISLGKDPSFRREADEMLYRNDFKSKKKMFSALRFALNNPLTLNKSIMARHDSTA